MLVLEGELDAAEAQKLNAAIETCADGVPVVVDLTSLSFIDSSGIHALVRGRPAAIVRAPESNVARVLDLVEVQKTIPVYDDMTQAVERLHAV